MDTIIKTFQKHNRDQYQIEHFLALKDRYI